MFVGRLVAGALLGALGFACFACGERAGDPVVASPGAPDQTGEAGAPSREGPTGLCGTCTSSADCGGASDACIRRQARGYCGRDCEDQRDCPDGYECVELNDDRLRQCVPASGCPDARRAPSVVEVKNHLFSRVNAERVARDQPPLEASACLDELAQESALELARTDEPLGKFVKECDPIWPACECGWSAEAELAISAYDLDWRRAIDRAVESYGANADTRFVRALLSEGVTQVGIGFWLSGDELWIALSFG